MNVSGTNIEKVASCFQVVRKWYVAVYTRFVEAPSNPLIAFIASLLEIAQRAAMNDPELSEMK